MRGLPLEDGKELGFQTSEAETGLYLKSPISRNIEDCNAFTSIQIGMQ
jgi:hypothetical protein